MIERKQAIKNHYKLNEQQWIALLQFELIVCVDSGEDRRIKYYKANHLKIRRVLREKNNTKSNILKILSKEKHFV